ncbi:hypothetical protein NQ318_012953 [Aromia moschata]|uniref:Uncharacterized protein n=1 Tax=Aromia moschata TaxID=1265417 RepID=A0AAV8XRD6_9CUCU|nr:hypothetical protein NQ318_012953 [Aromia moschata]
MKLLGEFTWAGGGLVLVGIFSGNLKSNVAANRNSGRNFMSFVDKIKARRLELRRQSCGFSLYNTTGSNMSASRGAMKQSQDTYMTYLDFNEENNRPAGK